MTAAGIAKRRRKSKKGIKKQRRKKIMAKLTREQLNKWNKNNGNGFFFDASYYIMWSEKRLVLKGDEDENGVHYVIKLEYITNRDNTSTPTAVIDRYTPTGTGDLCNVVEVYREAVGEPKSKKMFSELQKISRNINTAELFEKAKAPDTGETYNDLSFETEEPEENTVEESANENAGNDFPVSVGMVFKDSAGKTFTITELSSMQVVFNDGERSLIDFETSRTVGAVIDALGCGAFLEVDESTTENNTDAPEISAQGDAQTDTGTTKADVETAVSGNEEERNDSENMTTPTAEKTDATPTAENADQITPPGEYENPMHENFNAGGQDMFAELAKAYITGKTAPKPHIETPEPIEEPEEPKSDYNPPEPEPTKASIGYAGETSDILTDAEINDLLEGKQVIKATDDWRKRALFATRTNKAAFVYSVMLWSDSKNEIEPGVNAEYCGFIANNKYYPTTLHDAIFKDFYADVNNEILRRISTQTDAEKVALSDADEYTVKKITDSKGYDRTKQAQEHFYKDTAPTLEPYAIRKDEVNETLYINYITAPEETVTATATAFIENHPDVIACEYITYNKIRAALDDIINDNENEAHHLKKISASIPSDYKTVKITLENGETVTAEASAARWITSNGCISKYRINASDRNKLPRNKYNRADDIRADMIQSITHGGRILYKAS